jgi:hypothetical protein
MSAPVFGEEEQRREQTLEQQLRVALDRAVREMPNLTEQQREQIKQMLRNTLREYEPQPAPLPRRAVPRKSPKPELREREETEARSEQVEAPARSYVYEVTVAGESYRVSLTLPNPNLRPDDERAISGGTLDVGRLSEMLQGNALEETGGRAVFTDVQRVVSGEQPVSGEAPTEEQRLVDEYNRRDANVRLDSFRDAVLSRTTREGRVVESDEVRLAYSGEARR